MSFPEQKIRAVALALVLLALWPGPAAAEERTFVGNFDMSYYWVSDEADFKARPDTRIYDRQCKVIATVPGEFARRMSVEGTGKLDDGRVLNTAGSCDCGFSPCFFEVPARSRWGVGVANRALAPFRSIAVDKDIVPIGTRLYIPALDGLRMPGKRPWGGFVHDGCVIADDRGGAVRGHEIDFFAGLRAYYRVLQRKHRFETWRAYTGGERCERFGEGRPRQL